VRFKPYNHQLEGRDFIIDRDGVGALFYDMGLGKTLTALMIFSKLRYNCKMFVVCPNTIIEPAWCNDIRNFTDYRVWNMRKKEPSKWEIAVINYEAFISSRGKNLLHHIYTNRAFVVFDESSRLKNYKSKTVKLVLKHKREYDHVLIMSGTPAPNCETEYFAQMQVLNTGVFHHYYQIFLNEYFCMERNSQVTACGHRPGELMKFGWKIVLRKDKRDEFYDKIGRHSLFKKKEDCLDLPEKVCVVRNISFSSEERKIYAQMLNECIAYINHEAVVGDNVLKRLMKLRQITSGFAIDSEGKSVDLKPISSKQKELLNVLEELGNNQVIIWGNFRHEIEKINKILGDKSRILYGGTPSNERDSIVQGFKNGDYQYLIANPQTAGHGLTFTNCNYEIFYSMTYSYEYYEQARDRIHRIGQTNKCSYIHLLVERSIDFTMYNVVQRKGKKQDMIYQFFKDNKIKR
jgi:SNF2 family DNA or RNA helicase